MYDIFHYGGWQRNFGDNCIEYSMHNLISEQTKKEEKYLKFSSDLLPQTKDTKWPPPLLDTPQAEYINHVCRTVIIGAGGQIMCREQEESVSGWQFNATKEFISKLNIPLIVSSIGYNKFPNDPEFLSKCSDSLKLTYEKSSLFSVRNSGTAEKLNTIGIKADVVADPVTFIKNDLGKLKIPGIYDDDFVIGLNLAGDAPQKRYKTEQEVADFYLDIFKFCTEFLEEVGGGKVLFIPHVIIYDTYPANCLKTLFGNSLVCLDEACPWLYPENLFNVPLFLSAYQRCNMVLGQRGHANIIPFALGIPSFGIGNQEKVKYFQEDVGGLNLGMSPSKKLSEVYNAIFVDGNKNSVLREKKKTEMKLKSDNFYKKIGNLL